MTKHRRITGLVAIALAAAATAATMRSQSPSTARSNEPTDMMSFNELTAETNKLPTGDFSNQPPAHSTNVKGEAAH